MNGIPPWRRPRTALPPSMRCNPGRRPWARRDPRSSRRHVRFGIRIAGQAVSEVLGHVEQRASAHHAEPGYVGACLSSRLARCGGECIRLSCAWSTLRRMPRFPSRLIKLGPRVCRQAVQRAGRAGQLMRVFAARLAAACCRAARLSPSSICRGESQALIRLRFAYPRSRRSAATSIRGGLRFSRRLLCPRTEAQAAPLPPPEQSPNKP